MSATLRHGGLPKGVRRVDLLSLVENLGKRGLGLSSTATRVLTHLQTPSAGTDHRPMLRQQSPAFQEVHLEGSCARDPIFKPVSGQICFALIAQPDRIDQGQKFVKSLVFESCFGDGFEQWRY